MASGSGLFSNKGPLKPHLTEGKGGVAGEVADLRRDVGAALGGLAALAVNHWDSPPAADTDGIKTSVASSDVAVEYTGDDFDGAEFLVVTGTRDLDELTYGAGGALDGETLWVKVGASGVLQHITLAAPADKAAVATQLTAFTGITATVDGADHLVLTSATLPIHIVRATGNLLEDLGLELGVGVMVGARPFTVTTSDSAATWAGNFTVWGRDVRGRLLSETKALANNTTISTTTHFKSIEKWAVDPQNNAAGTLLAGFGATLGLEAAPKMRSGRLVIMQELEDGAAPAAAGALSLPSANPPYGAYTPNSAPNGARDFTLYFEADPTI